MKNSFRSGPKALSWILVLIASLFLLCGLLLIASPPGLAQVSDAPINVADRPAIPKAGQIIVFQRAFVFYGEGPAIPVPLPQYWGVGSHPGYRDAAWYSVQVQLMELPKASLSVLLPKVSMNADVWLNGQLVGRQGSMDEPLTRHRNTPLLFDIPANHWHLGENVLTVRVKSKPQYSGALGSVVLGPSDRLQSQYRQRIFWGKTVRDAGATYAVGLGFFVLLIWMRTRRQMHYAYFAFGTMFVGAANLLTWTVDIPLSNDQWQRGVNVVFCWGYCLLTIFGLRYADVQARVPERTFLAVAIFNLLTQVFSSDASYMPVYVLANALPALAGPIVLLLMLRSMHARAFAGVGVFAMALILVALAGVHDWLLVSGRLPVTHVYVLPYALPLLLTAMAWLIAGEYMRAHSDLENLSKGLAAQLRTREKELQQSFQSLAQERQALAVSQERARILRDMHDGVGAHITTAIRQIQSGQVNPQEIENSLRDSLDRLKLSIDSMTLEEGDVEGLLASFRYRIEPRLKALNIRMLWSMADLPQWAGGTQDALRQLQFILLEALSNSLQHSKAKGLALGAEVVGDKIRIRFADDGIGGQLSLDQGNGLRGMQERAQGIGASVRIEQALPGTAVLIDLPI